ncbi:MAG: tetratricopeptide repeat protein [Acidobacteria bacterium]|nr:tetratricopeptide repeat protein [Acidobacteriota bacterium]
MTTLGRAYAGPLVMAATLAGLLGCGTPDGTGASLSTASQPTFARDVAPILFEHCAGCHHPEGSAPFSLLEYASARARGARIVDATGRRVMPPWLPEPGHGDFAGARLLTEEQIDILRGWVANGMPEGDADHLPPRPRTGEGWQLGEPDLVVRMPQPYTLPPGDSDVFRNFVIPVPGSEIRHVKTVELRPGSPRVVHHALLGVDEMRGSRRLDAGDPGPGFGGMEMGEAHMPDGSLLGWTPGMLPFPGIEGMAWRLQPRTDLVLQLHLLPGDAPQTVQGAIGFHFAEPDEVGDAAYVIILDADEQLDIPAGEPAFTVTDAMELPVDVEVLVVYPHAHYLGRRLEGWATLPDGATRSLIRIDEWDFQWQDVYRYREPVALPKGTTVGMRWTFDNSADNPSQRNAPPRRVVAGNRSSDEMAHLQLQVRLRDHHDRAVLQAAHYEHLLGKNARSPRLLYGLGGALRDQERLADAVRAYRRALALQPGYVAAHINLAAVLLTLGETEAGTDHLRTAVRLDPDAAGAHYNLGLVSASRGRLDEAARHYREALQSVPDYGEAHNNLGQVLAVRGELAEAVRSLRAAVRLMPASADVHNNLGRTLGALGELDEAMRHLRIADGLEPDSAEIQTNLGTGLLLQGRVAEAIGRFRRALQLEPGNPRARESLAAALAQAGAARTR